MKIKLDKVRVPLSKKAGMVIAPKKGKGAKYNRSKEKVAIRNMGR
jgi:hypothetical protein